MEEYVDMDMNNACSICDKNYGNRCTLFSHLYNKVRLPDDCPDFRNFIDNNEESMDSPSADDTDEDMIDAINDQNDRLDYLNNH